VGNGNGKGQLGTGEGEVGILFLLEPSLFQRFVFTFFLSCLSARVFSLGLW